MGETVSMSLRLPATTAAWVEDYARQRGVSKTEVIVAAVASFREDSEAGVPEVADEEPGPVVRDEQFTEVARVQAMSYGDLVARATEIRGGRSRQDFARATAERGELFSRMDPDKVKKSTAPRPRAS